MNSIKILENKIAALKSDEKKFVEFCGAQLGFFYSHKDRIDSQKYFKNLWNDDKYNMLKIFTRRLEFALSKPFGPLP